MEDHAAVFVVVVDDDDEVRERRERGCPKSQTYINSV